MTNTEPEVRKHVGIDAGEPWPAFAWPGGYPIIYIMDDGGVLCAQCMNTETESVHFGGQADGWRVEGADIFYEGPTMQCDHCGADIESAYGDPDEDEAQS